MANGNSLFSFLSGVAVGATIAILAFTERGHEFMQDVKKKGERAFDKAMRKMEAEAELEDFDDDID